MKLIYGTGNSGKIKQVKDYFSTTDLDLEIISIKDLGIDIDVEETGTTFEENSLLKAKVIKECCDKKGIKGIIVCDDSGLCVECLNGAPGVYSARYAGDHAPQEIVLEKLLKEMKATGSPNRRAKFVCVLTAIMPDNEIIVVRGENDGHILEEPSIMGKLTFDPVFVPDGFDKPMVELEDKDLDCTHREKAFIKLLEVLKNR